MHWRILLVLLFILSAIDTRAQNAAVSINAAGLQGGGGTGPSILGWEFSVNVPIQVTALGMLDHGGDVGISRAHSVGLWRVLASGTPLATATIAEGTAAELRDSFRYGPIAPVDLLPGEHYALGVLYYNDVRDLVVGNYNNPQFILSVNPAITFTFRRSVGATSLIFPSQIDTEFVGDFGPNMLFTVVPEPEMIGMLALGLAAMVAVRRLVCSNP